MVDESDSRSFISLAKRGGVSDETVLLILRERGWNERRAREELVAYYEDSLGIATPVRADAASSNPLDGFLYVFATGTLISWVVATLNLTNTLVDQALPSVREGRGSESGLAGMVVWATATLLVTGPTYLVLMGILHRRLKAGATAWASPVRLWVLSATLLLGVATILGYVIGAIALILGGEPSLASGLKTLVALGLVGGLVAYYLRWLRARGTP